MAFERQWASIAPRSLTSDGTALGVVTVASTTGFRIKQVIALSNSSVPNSSKPFQVKQVLSKTQLVVGPVDQKIPGTTSDVSGFTVALGANISAGKQDKNAVPDKDHYSAIYEGDPVVADRVVLVDENGDIFGQDNPVPVNASISVVVPPVTVDIDALTPPTRPDPDNVLAAGSEDGTKTGLKHALRVDSALDLRVGLSNGANKANISGSGDLSVRDSNADVLLSTRASEATLSALSAKFNSLGQKTMAASTPVVLASDQSALAVTVASLPLPTGAATEAKQDAQIVIESAINGKLNSLGQKNMAGSMPVVLATDQSPIPVTASLADEPVKISGTENGQPGGPEFTFVNNIRQQILAAKDRDQAISYADFGNKNQRITQIDYTAPSIGAGAGFTARKTFTYTLVGTRYRRDNITWSII